MAKKSQGRMAMPQPWLATQGVSKVRAKAPGVNEFTGTDRATRAPMHKGC